MIRVTEGNAYLMTVSATGAEDFLPPLATIEWNELE
jgi:hypothetical protein